jgi:hypothetical protein
MQLEQVALQRGEGVDSVEEGHIEGSVVPHKSVDRNKRGARQGDEWGVSRTFCCSQRDIALAFQHDQPGIKVGARPYNEFGNLLEEVGDTGRRGIYGYDGPIKHLTVGWSTHHLRLAVKAKPVRVSYARRAPARIAP